MKVGDRVRLSSYGITTYGPNHANPWDCVGVITFIGDTQHMDGYYSCRVDWDNGSWNNYRTCHLELIERKRKGFAQFVYNKL